MVRICALMVVSNIRDIVYLNKKQEVTNLRLHLVSYKNIETAISTKNIMIK